MIRVALCQFETGSRVTAEEKQRLSRLGADFIAFPEYFFAPQGPGTQRREASREEECLGRLAGLSVETGAAVVGGTIVEERDGRLYNACPLFDGGREIARYRKRHPTEREISAGISPGTDPVVVPCRGVRVALLICADVLQPGRFEEAGRLGAQVLFTPVVSPRRDDDTPAIRHERDRTIFQQGARAAGAFVVKTAAPGRVFGGPLQGRSLVAAPWGIVARVRPGEEQSRVILLADLEPSRLPPAESGGTAASS